MPIRIKELYIHPLKSGCGLSVAQAQLDCRGFEHDRQFMVVDLWSGEFLSQRTHPKLATVRSRIEGNSLILNAKIGPELEISLDPNSYFERKRKVTIHKDTCDAYDLGTGANAWFSTLLNRDCTLVRMANGFRRPVPGTQAQVGFADGYPLLVISEASLADLNSRLAVPLPMDRFRPNIVIEGCGPYAEDTMGVMRVAGVRIQGMKPCGRCKITTIDQQTGAGGSEPLKTLATYRRLGKEVIFGMNFVHLDEGTIRVGDELMPT